MGLPPRMPASAVNSTRGLASSMRSKALRREASKNYRMNRARRTHARHGKHCFRNHRHIDQNAIAFADTLLFQHRRTAIYSRCSSRNVYVVLFDLFQ